MKTYGFGPNNAGHFNKDFIVGGNERAGYFAVHGWWFSVGVWKVYLSS